MFKVLLITNMPAEYRVELFNLMAVSKSQNFNFLFIDESDIKHKKIIWAQSENICFSKSSFISTNNKFKINYLLFKEIFKIRPKSIIIGGIPSYFPLIILLKPIFKYKITCWWAGHEYSESNDNMRLKYRKTSAKFISNYLFYSDLSRRYFNTKIKTLKDNYYTIGNNTRISTKEIEQLNSFDIRKPEDSFKIITVGFQKNKNTKLLIQAMINLNKKNLEIQLNIVGEGPDIPELKQLVIDNNIKNINFLGSLKPIEIKKELLKHHLFVHPSYFDRWPQVFNEASYCKLPILITKQAGVVNDYTEEHKDLVFFDPENSNDLANKISIIYNNPILREQLSLAAFNAIKNNDGEKVFEKITELITRENEF